ncbi:MAG: hypothetical protein WA182_19495 [Candidatus Sulfotelmatobacter sp.]
MTKTEKLLTTITTAATFETTDRGYDLLIAMRELLSRLKSNDWDSGGYRVEPEELEASFLTLFRLWRDATGYKLLTTTEQTIEDAFTVIYGVSATYGKPA